MAPVCTGLLSLPRELRDQIYEECLLVSGVVSLLNLRTEESYRPVPQSLGITPKILRSCRQVYEEASAILYGSNIFCLDVTAMWRYYKPLQWRRCFQLGTESLNACLACQHYDNRGLFSLPDETIGLPKWTQKLSLVRRLQICVQPYTYLQWRHRHHTAFPRQYLNCPHAISGIFESLCLQLLVIRVAKRGLLLSQEACDLREWRSIALPYQTEDAKKWRSHARMDTNRETRALLAAANDVAEMVVLSGPGYRPYIATKSSTTPSAFTKTFLSTGKLCSTHYDTGCDTFLGLEPELIDGLMNRVEDSGDDFVCSNGRKLAQQSIHQASC